MDITQEMFTKTNKKREKLLQKKEYRNDINVTERIFAKKN